MMGYAIKPDGSWRMVTPEMELAEGEVYQDALPEPTPEQAAKALLAEMERVVEAFLDGVAKERGYTRLSIPGYVLSPNDKWMAEALAYVRWRDLQVWPTCYEIMAACEAGERGIPSPDELVAELPKIVWPDL